MARSAAEIEADVIAKVSSRRLKTRGMWWTLRTLIEQNEGKHPGDLRTPDGALVTAEELGNHTNASAATVLSCLRQLETVGLLQKLDGGGWHSRHLARLHELRVGIRERVRRHRKRALRNTPKGVTYAPCNADVTPPGPSPPSLSPTPPISIPPTPEYPNAAHSACGGASANGKASGKRKTRKPTVFPEGVWERAVEGWARAFRHVHGSEFHWNPRQTKGLSEVLTALGGDVGRFEAVAKAWLREEERGPVKGHPLWQLAVDLNYIESKIATGRVGQPAGNGAPGYSESSEQWAQRIAAKSGGN